MKYILINTIVFFAVQFLQAQNVGIGTSDPKAKLDVSGDMILKSIDLNIPDGTIYQLDVNTNKYNQYKLVGPTSNFQIAGIAAAEHDRTVALYNRTGVSLEVYNDDINTLQEDRILTGTGGTFAVYNGGNVVLKYDTLIAKWEIISSHYNSLDNFGSSWAGNANDIYNTNSGNVGIGTNSPVEKLSVVGNVDITGDIKTSGVAGQTGDVLQNNGNGTMSWMPMTQNQNGSVGYGTFGCEMENVTDYNPILTNSNEASYFGSSAAIQGNFAIIGAPAATINGQINRGCAYIYQYDGTNWIQQQKITASDGVADDQFGYEASIYGNWAIVTAIGTDYNGYDEMGAVYVFFFNGTDWTQIQKITDNNGFSYNYFGYSLSIDETYIAIADIAENLDRGSVHLYTFDGNQWIHQFEIIPSGALNGDKFGSAVSIEGNSLIVGSAWDDNNFTDQGSVYFYLFNGTNWTQIIKLNPPIPQNTGRFGCSVSQSNGHAVVGSTQNMFQFFKFENNTWNAKRYYTGVTSGSVVMSGEYTIISLGKIYKLTPQSWILFETVNDPEGISPGAEFSACTIDEGKFLMCAPSALNASGLAIFGKIKE